MRCLARSQDRELDALGGKNFQGFQIYRRLREPRTLGITRKTMLKIFNAPKNLRALIARVRERKDGVVVSLRESSAVSGKKFLALAIAIEDALIAFWRALLHPREQCWTEVEADFRVIVYDVGDAAFGVEYARSAVGKIALSRYPFVPVVIRTCRILRLNRFQPGVFPRRLIKMTMNAGKTLHR